MVCYGAEGMARENARRKDVVLWAVNPVLRIRLTDPTREIDLTRVVDQVHQMRGVVGVSQLARLSSASSAADMLTFWLIVT
jgi:hypothetical protein